MPRALLIGGTRFIGRHATETFLDAGYDVTLFNRGKHQNPFADRDRVDQFTGDRTSGAALADARDEMEPDVVVDCVAYHPGEVRMATDVFSDVDAYVYISSGASYVPREIPKREDETPLNDCTDEQAVSDDWDTYGNRKAEGDRAIVEAAEEGVQAMAVRPTIVYGPHDYSGRFDYWIDRVENYDRVIVPGDGNSLHHLVSVENVARALLTVAEEGEAGEAYNAGDRRLLTLGDVVETVADAVGTDVEMVTAGPRELATGGIEPEDVPLYADYPHVLTTEKLFDLGWEPVAPEDAIAETVAADDEVETERWPDREAEESVLEILDTL
ncbi:NAD-dependent epimerase/dehydratase family protein [Halobacteriales archaeon Cl-PHB]